MRKVTLILFVIFIAGCGMKTGEDALNIMSKDQKEIALLMKNFTRKTTVSEISNHLGEPSSGGVGGVNPEWTIMHGEKETRLRAYFVTNGLNKIQYISLKPMWGYTLYYNDNGANEGS